MCQGVLRQCNSLYEDFVTHATKTQHLRRTTWQMFHFPVGKKTGKYLVKLSKPALSLQKVPCGPPIQNRHSVRLRFHVEKSTSNPVGCMWFAYYLCWAFKRRMINFFFFPLFWSQENLLEAGNLCPLRGKSSTWGLSTLIVPVLNTPRKRHIRDAHLSNIPLTNSLPFCNNHCKRTDLFPHLFLLKILQSPSIGRRLV